MIMAVRLRAEGGHGGVQPATARRTRLLGGLQAAQVQPQRVVRMRPITGRGSRAARLRAAAAGARPARLAGLRRRPGWAAVDGQRAAADLAVMAAPRPGSAAQGLLQQRLQAAAWACMSAGGG
jgi:hypothetical protein